MGQIQYSEKYFDDTCEYRHVVLPPEVAKLLPKNRLLSENEWRGSCFSPHPSSLSVWTILLRPLTTTTTTMLRHPMAATTTMPHHPMVDPTTMLCHPTAATTTTTGATTTTEATMFILQHKLHPRAQTEFS
ncbi:Cyclin-dependent kinases regulatory subunit (Cell division control protein cks1) [Orobanche gracilis]